MGRAVLGHTASTSAGYGIAIFYMFDASSYELLGEEPPLEDGYIEPSKPASEVRQDPYPLPKEFVWSTVDVSDNNQVCSTNAVLAHI